MNGKAGVRGFRPGVARMQTKAEIDKVAMDAKRRTDEFATGVSKNPFSRLNSKPL